MSRRPLLVPAPGWLYVVRWVRADGRTVKHRYYRRRHDARVFLAKLHGLGKDAEMFATGTEWVSTW